MLGYYLYNITKTEGSILNQTILMYELAIKTKNYK